MQRLAYGNVRKTFSLYRKFMKKGHTIHMAYMQRYTVSEDGVGGTCSLCCFSDALGGEEPQIPLCKFNYHNKLTF